jgi:acyl carrier protein
VQNRFRCLVLLAIAANGCAPRAEPGMATGRTNPPDNVERTVRAAIADLLKVDASSIPMDQPISSPPLKADELDLVEIVLELEERLDIEIDDATVERQAGPLGKGPLRITPNQLVTIAREAPKAQVTKRKK